jgi:hypothetical protein
VPEPAAPPTGSCKTALRPAGKYAEIPYCGFLSALKTRPTEKSVKSGKKCVAKREKRSFAELQCGLGQSRSVYLAEISGFARLRPT